MAHESPTADRPTATDPATPVFQPPRVNAVGIVEYADDTGSAPRTFSPAQRLAVWIFLAFFFVATVGTTVLSLGAYCLTSHGADTRALHASPLLDD